MTLTLGVLDRGVRIADPDRVDDDQRARPDPQVPERARRRTFTAKYKMQILAEYAAAEQIARLQAEKKQLELELAKARFVVDVQAKLHALLETISESADTEPRSTP